MAVGLETLVHHLGFGLGGNECGGLDGDFVKLEKLCVISDGYGSIPFYKLVLCAKLVCFTFSFSCKFP